MYRWPFRRTVRLLWWALCTLVLASVPYTIWEFKENGYSEHYVGWTLSGIFVLLTIPVTIYQVALHVTYYNQPSLQRHVVRILFMVPIYALLKSGNYDAWASELPPQAPVFPLNGRLGKAVGMKTIYNGQEFMHAMRKGVLAYVVVRPCLALIQVVCMLTYRWGEDEFTFTKGWLWCMVTNNIMQAWALYCLVAMYKATCSELADIHPLRKFIVIKMVVFFSFWQGFLLSVLGHFKLFGDESVATYDTKALAGSIQNLLICIECLPASLAFAVAFPARDYMRPGQHPGTIFENIVNMLDVRDLGQDMSSLVEDQVTYASTLAAQGMVDAATTAHGVGSAIYQAPMGAVAKPVRHFARSYFNSGTAPVSLVSTEPGHAMQPLLHATSCDRGGS